MDGERAHQVSRGPASRKTHHTGALQPGLATEPRAKDLSRSHQELVERTVVKDVTAPSHPVLARAIANGILKK